MKQIGVECKFLADGSLLVRRLEIDGHWLPVEQGRQWADRQGRHVLVLLPGDQPREIVLRPETMTWALLPLGRQDVHVV